MGFIKNIINFDLTIYIELYLEIGDDMGLGLLLDSDTGRSLILLLAYTIMI